MKRDRCAHTGSREEPRPGGAKREGVHCHRAARGIRAVDRLCDVAQPDTPKQQPELSKGSCGETHRGDETSGIDSRRCLNRFDGEQQARAIFGLRRIPNRGGGTEGECRRRGERRASHPPQRRPGGLLPRSSCRADGQQANDQRANALHAEHLPWHVALSTQVNYLQSVTALGHTPLRLSELLTPDRIRVPIRAQSKEGVLREWVELLVGSNGAAPDVLQAVMERERQFPTGIGYGVAVPHGKTPALANLIAVAGTARTPVPYETVDGEPVRLFFLLAGPESQAGAHVKALSRISRLVRREPIRARLLAASDAQEFYRILVEAEAGGGG